MSEIWKRKMRTSFQIMDSDKDGVLSRKEFDVMFNESCADIKDDPIQQERKRKIHEDLWLIFSGSTITNEKRLLTEAVMIDSLMKHINDPKLKAAIQDSCQLYFDATDTNKDGYIDLEDYRRGYDDYGISDKRFIEQSFKVIDANHDGKISLDELTHATLEFTLSEYKDSPYNMFFGYLIGL